MHTGHSALNWGLERSFLFFHIARCETVSLTGCRCFQQEFGCLGRVCVGFARGPKHSHHIPSLLRSLTFSFLRRVDRSPQYLSPDPAPSARSVGFLSLGMGRERGAERSRHISLIVIHTTFLEYGYILPGSLPIPSLCVS